MSSRQATSSVIRESTSYSSGYSSSPNVAHSVVINRTLPGTRAKTIERSVKTNVYQSGAPMPDYLEITTTGVSNVREARDHEKKDMQDLNERFANYIDKVRNLEALNRKLVDELEKLKAKWGKETAQIKAMFQAELDEMRKALDEAEKEKARLEIRIASIEEQIDELRIELQEYLMLTTTYNEKFIFQTQILFDYENQIPLLRKRIESLENERDKDKRLIETLTEALAKAREDLDNETLCHIDEENRCQTLEEEIEFLKRIHDQELKELQALCYRDTSPENLGFWKNEMENAMREIAQMYEDKYGAMEVEMQSTYKTKVSAMQNAAEKTGVASTQVKEDASKCKQELADLRDRLNQLNNENAELMKILERLRREKEMRERELELRNSELQHECAALKAELDAILRALNSVLSMKASLEIEIAAYRKLLESEESRLSMKSVMESMSMGGGGGGGGGGAGGFGGSSFESSMGSMAKGEISAKTTYQKSAKGPVAISECPPDGKFVQIENTGSKEENLVGWKVTRKVDDKEITPFELDSRFAAVRPRQKISLFAKGQKPRSAATQDIEVNIDSWGIGATAYTRLINKEGEERASNIQRTSYSS